MSIGFIAGREAPVIWRGPLLARALQQFLNQVEWGPLDYLLVDLPPGHWRRAPNAEPGHCPVWSGDSYYAAERRFRRC